MLAKKMFMLLAGKTGIQIYTGASGVLGTAVGYSSPEVWGGIHIDSHRRGRDGTPYKEGLGRAGPPPGEGSCVIS